MSKPLAWLMGIFQLVLALAFIALALRTGKITDLLAAVALYAGGLLALPPSRPWMVRNFFASEPGPEKLLRWVFILLGLGLAFSALGWWLPK